MMYLVRCVPSRMDHVDKMRAQIPGLIAWVDEDGNAMMSFRSALLRVWETPAVILEDDVELTSNFCEKAEAVIAGRPGHMISFFNLSKKYRESRYEPGTKFCMAQCIYLPGGFAPQIAAYCNVWPRRLEHPTGTDLIIADWLKERQERYYIHCPSLVQHRPVASVIDPRRSRFRQSVTFEP